MKKNILSISYEITAEMLAHKSGEDMEENYLLKNSYRKLGEAYAREYATVKTYYVFLHSSGDEFEFTNKEDGDKDRRLSFLKKKVFLVLS